MSKWIGGVALALAAVSFAPAPASATHVCLGVEKVGTFGPPLAIGPTCEPSPNHFCDTTEVGLHPTLMVYVYFCVPR